ncbi:DUF1552 domain-containing protein [Marinicellulosiphila megalodicopiae]|uniref:DUF1552 domain-containing protein n=1 Tax=Marinicellulosiphila megalodicopiae TaxID=2724896 RepID=UPI003BAF8BDA
MSLNRRAFLSSAAVTLSLPWMESQASTQHQTKRFVGFYVPNGIHMQNFDIENEGQLQTLSPILSPLESIKHKLTVVAGLKNTPAKPNGAGDHASGTASFMSVAHPKKTNGLGIKNGITIDQVIANHLKSSTPVPSLQLGLEGGSSIGDCDSGYSCAYPRNISWASDTQPLPKIVNPRLVFDYLFAGEDKNETVIQREKRLKRQTSVLDYVNDQAKALSNKISFTDRQKMNEYLTSVRETELKMQATAQSCGLDLVTGQYNNVEAHSEIMTDIMVMALSCNHTPVISYMMGNGGSQRNYGFLDIEGGHHDISHHQNRKSNFEKLTKINHWEITQYADLVNKLDQINEGEGTLLDQCCVFLSSEVSDGNRHNHTNLPVIYAGSLGGNLLTGQNVKRSFRSIGELYISIAQTMGVELNQFGDAFAPLQGIALNS